MSGIFKDKNKENQNQNQEVILGNAELQRDFSEQEKEEK